MDEKKYIESERLQIMHFWGSTVLLIGSVVFVLLSLLDYYVTPENFSKFLVYRLISASLIMSLYAALRSSKSYHFQVIIISIAALIAASTVELMIISFGGHESIYYAGLIIVFTFILGFLPLFSLRITFALALATYAIYLIPILLFDEITNPKVFINNNIFLLATATIGLLWRHYNDSILLKKLSLEYELAKDKKRLADYSSHLEVTVKDRTKELRKSETMLKTLYENANDGIIISDRFGIIINANALTAEMHGFEKDQLLGMNIELLELDENKILWAERMDRLLKGEALIYETEHYKKDGSTIKLEISAKAIEIEGELLIQSILRDISEKKKLQDQLLHSQRMESIGTLAGGIAHDFNNILTSILGFTDLILDNEKPSPGTASKLRVIENAARKGSTMISKLLSFARKGSIEAVPFMINPVIEDTLEMLSRLIPKNIKIRKELNSTILPAKGDVNQIEQVLMNLIINAKDAMPDGGEITILSDVVELGPDALNIAADIRSGKFVKVSLSDTGKGIHQKLLDRIFEPFFTTKEVGKGTGLGLAMVYGIIKEHSGYINVDSKPGRGTTFDIYLPTTSAPVGITRSVSAPHKKGTAIDKILVIDDEIPVLELIKQTLLKSGFDVIVFNSPAQGLEYFKSHLSRVGLVITDMVMPTMGGDQVIAEVRELNPFVKIIAITGFFEALENTSVDGFIKKPFQSSKLLTTINEILN